MTGTKDIFIDTSAFKAVFDQGDEFHKQSWKFWQEAHKNDICFITSNYILDEVYTLFRAKAGKAKALLLRDSLAESPQSVTVTWVQLDDERVAWEYFAKLPGRGVSFTDCTSFALMKRLNLKVAFTFDGDFKSAGFSILPEK
ncbi:PIN domain-containing protein [Candidatus Gottesmanbacteria bacterium]|nr:PIN domain-containing protein [Candidatus Gottesmanbacteria bacterium]